MDVVSVSLRQNRLRPLLLVALTALPLLLAACEGGDSGVGRNDLNGRVNLVQAEVIASPDDCSGTGRFESINASTEVVVRDGTGGELGVGTLGSGRSTSSGCRFDYEVVNLPEVERYTIVIRGFVEESFTFDELEDRDWEVDFEIGG